MTGTAATVAAVPFTLENLVYAKVLTDTFEEMTFGPVKRFAGALDAKINPNASTAIYYRDNGAGGAATAKGAVEIEVGIDAVSKEVRADVLGSEIDANGVLLDSPDDVAPYVAFGFTSETDGGGKQYYWFYKGKFEVPSDNFATRTDKVDFQTGSIKGTFVKPNFHPKDRASVNSKDADLAAGVIENWFNNVYLPAQAAPVTP